MNLADCAITAVSVAAGFIIGEFLIQTFYRIKKRYKCNKGIIHDKKPSRTNSKNNIQRI